VKPTLALDIATNTGFAIANVDGRIESGDRNFPLAHGHEGRRFIDFRAWLADMLKLHTPERIIYERVVHIGDNGAYAAQIYGGFLAIVLMLCEHHQLEHEGFSVAVIKKAWTGKGNADKAAMIARCKELGFKPKSSDEADAIAILHVGTGKCPPLSIERQMERFKRKPRANPDQATQSLGLQPRNDLATHDPF
jgi:Holliday junction resolvasome RuvABC endonuclease subunit